MRIDVLMPVITAEGEEAVVTAWFVDEGGACTAGQLVAEVQAEKVSDEVFVPEAGYVVDRVAIGDPIHQGRPICSVVDELATTSAAPPTVAPPIKASPAAKRVARELGVELAGLTGTGPDGRITEEDVRNFGGGRASGTLRSVIARNMRRSHAETAPVTLFSTVDLGAVIPSRLTARIVKAVAFAVPGHPMLNGRRDGDHFVPSSRANISLAIQTDEGLVAPVIHDASEKTVDEIAAIVGDLAERARTKHLTATDYEGGTFSITNLGNYRIDGFTPVINLPEVAILGIGAARPVPVVGADGAITASNEMVLSLTFDHAFIDGAPAADFLQEVANHLTS